LRTPGSTGFFSGSPVIKAAAIKTLIIVKPTLCHAVIAFLTFPKK
jgi:hypothetical protein